MFGTDYSTPPLYQRIKFMFNVLNELDKHVILIETVEISRLKSTTGLDKKCEQEDGCLK